MAGLESERPHARVRRRDGVHHLAAADEVEDAAVNPLYVVGGLGALYVLSQSQKTAAPRKPAGTTPQSGYVGLATSLATLGGGIVSLFRHTGAVNSGNPMQAPPAAQSVPYGPGAAGIVGQTTGGSIDYGGGDLPDDFDYSGIE
jgi:hypothetical protein